MHNTLRQYRVIPTAVILFLMFLTADMTSWYQEHYLELKEWMNAPVIAYLSSLVAGLFKCAQIVLNKNEKDED